MQKLVRICGGDTTELNEYLKQVNAELPVYSGVGVVEVREEPFEKTPKRSIKRFLYS